MSSCCCCVAPVVCPMFECYLWFSVSIVQFVVLHLRILFFCFLGYAGLWLVRVLCSCFTDYIVLLLVLFFASSLLPMLSSCCFVSDVSFFFYACFWGLVFILSILVFYFSCSVSVSSASRFFFSRCPVSVGLINWLSMSSLFMLFCYFFICLALGLWLSVLAFCYWRSVACFLLQVICFHILCFFCSVSAILFLFFWFYCSACCVMLPLFYC